MASGPEYTVERSEGMKVVIKRLHLSKRVFYSCVKHRLNCSETFMSVF